jgi:heterodisulfide reductase subunit A
MKDEIVELEVGSVILAPGFEPFDPKYDSYNYANHPNVITAMEMERLLSASGPTGGHLVRMSDHKEPKKIAWFQCVGSRDMNRCDNSYCSSVCCMYAIKEAVIAKEHAGDALDCAIFYMDMRTHGKDFERFYNKAQDDGVRFHPQPCAHHRSGGDSGDLLCAMWTMPGLGGGEIRHDCALHRPADPDLSWWTWPAAWTLI